MSPVGRLQRPQMARFMAPQVAQRAAQTMVRQSPLGRFGRLGAFGSTAVNQGVTGVKAGVTASGAATAVGAGVASAIGAGAAAGSVVPIIGTAIGAIVGLVASGVFNHRADPEVGNFNQAVAVWQSSRLNALNIANKYLVLAGLFDLLPGQIKGNIPIYKKYGRMGEQAFVTDMGKLIYAAAQAGQITARDTPQTVMTNVVQPWIDSWGFGPMVDTHADLITLIILGMVAEYLAGAQNRWLAVGGDYPFGSLPKFSLPNAAPPPPAPIAAPLSVNAPAQPVAPVSPNGSSITPTSGGSLFTAMGEWKFAPGNVLLLNGNDSGARVVLAFMYNGTLYVRNPPDVGGQWSAMVNGAWTSANAPPGAPAGNAPAQPAQSPAGTLITAPSSAVLTTPQGSFQFTTTPTPGDPGGYFLLVNGAQNGGGTQVLWNGSQVLLKNGAGAVYLWTPAGWVLQTAAPAASTAPAATTPITDPAAGAPSLTGNPYPASGVVPYYPPSYAPAPDTSGTPAVGTPVTAAGVAGLPSWLTWGAALGVVGLLFATARPVGSQGARRPSRRKA